ncbi:hypothetical protein D9M73_153450 [compost metagenome]
MVVVRWYLPDRAREADWQLAGRVVVAEQNVSDGVAAFGASEPGFQHGVGLLLLPAKGQWTAVHQDQHQRFARGFQGADQLALAGRDFQGSAARRFMRHAARFTDGCHDHVCLFGGGNGFVDHHLGRARIDDHFRTVEV